MSHIAARIRRTLATAFLAWGTFAGTGDLALADASPSPAPQRPASAAPSATARASRERLAIATCSRTYFYTWPAKDSAPATADYPPATNGDAFHVIGPPQLSFGGLALYETTIDVVEPWGAGKHYYVAEACVNLG
jgi:hypothetical protein